MNDIDLMYKEMILDLYRHPINQGVLAHPDVVHTEHNPVCGDVITIHMQRDNDIIKAITHSGHGCAISQAAISLITIEITGKSTETVLAMTPSDVNGLLGFEPIYTRKKCAYIGLEAVQNALRH